MKKLLLIISLLTTSIYTSATECVPPLLPSIQLAPYIHRIINSNESTSDQRLEDLQELIGIRVTGEHRFYPEGQNHRKHTLVKGVIQDVTVLRPSEDLRKIIYEMTIASKGPEGENLQKFAFSGSYSPGFSILETDQELHAKLAKKVASVQEVKLPFNLLSIGLDTPQRVADYKENLWQQGAVVFDGKEDPYYELSDSYERPIVIDGEIWPSVRHYIEAQKFVYPDDRYKEYVMSVRVAISPEEAIRMGKSETHPIRPDWKEVRDQLMFKALAAKFTQHRDLYDLLVNDTDDALIVKHTEEDHYWGDGENRTGKSVLGNLLMELRGQLRRGNIPADAGYAKHEFHEKTLLGYLLHEVEMLISQDAEYLAEQIASSNISDIEKIDRIQMILLSIHFSTRFISENHTSKNEWVDLINIKYPEDKSFTDQLVRIGISFPLSRVLSL